MSDQTRVTASLLDKARAQGKPLVTYADDAYICAAPILRDEEILAESLIRVDDLTDRRHRATPSIIASSSQGW